jgi:hypothetical protein
LACHALDSLRRLASLRFPAQLTRWYQHHLASFRARPDEVGKVPDQTNCEM